MEDEAIGHDGVKEEVRRSAGELSAGQNDHEGCVFEVTGRRVHVCVPHTPPPCMFEAAITSQHTEGLGVEIQFHFFFLTNDTLTVGKNVGVPEQISQLQK